ncbi:guanylate kinase [Trichococcus collinsii]|uniref:Guanylate kinase n=1 Tax=Trichococcus collinsii TaxID=157076 RepID=A0AB37ZW13_9LACT|nr:guanylate kinase [Trichococcus collinsii]CZQ84786.1 guanylate kinase/l-type calcium channel beta subunit [Trichococcus collinsii]SDZ80958.1 guanylate kinase [Trichococcus collinsii]HEX5350014.1 guanylate kinase [Trichococcus sp.]
MTEKGLLIVLSGPSGVGKGTVRQAIFSRGEREFIYSISATTRKAREGEVDGKDYFFKEREEFERMIADNELLEYTEYVDNYYGTPIDYVRRTLDTGKDIFLEIEVQGAMQVKERMPEGIFIFLTPPDMTELESRIVNRGTDESPIIKQRMEKAIEELSLMRYYDYAVENDTVENAVQKVLGIIQSEHLKVSRILDTICADERE